MTKQYVNNLQAGQNINDNFAVCSKTPLTKYNAKEGQWFSLVLSDKTGIIPLKFWGGPNDQAVKDLYKSLKINDIVTVNGSVKIDSFSGKLEISINEGSGQIIQATNYDLEDYVPKTDKNIDELVTQLKAEINNITNEHIKQLLKSFFDDASFTKKYSETPAAKSYHHSYVGGLIEHVSSMIELSKVIAKQYEPNLNLDLMIAGCILHDIGKMVEYETKAVIDYTVTGSLLGHIPIGAKMVEDKIEKIENFPPILKNKIIHLILSHHGSQIAGSPVIPHFPEAVALHKIDDCDAQVKHALQVKKQLSEGSEDEIVRAGKEFGFMYMR